MKMNSQTVEAAPRPRKRVRRLVVRWTERVFAIFGLCTAIYLLTLDVSVVTSTSMRPTLQGTTVDNGDRVVTEKVTRWFRRPRRWEVIAFTRDDGAQLLKRVAGLPGETVQLNDARKLVIDGEQMDFPAGLNEEYLRFGNLVEGRVATCGEGYYVLGDDLKDSDDSRFNGPVSPDRVVGRVWLIVWPLSRFGFVR